MIHGRAQALDHLLISLWSQHFSDADQLCLIAVGGYGRGELHPYSDVDLLVLVETAQPPKALSGFLTTLWDTGLEIGHSVRSVEQCEHEARKDVTVMTTLMETRLLTGPSVVFDRLVAKLGENRLWRGVDYFEAKWDEQNQRHARYRDLGYSLEPNLKGGAGGLRDIQTVSWVAKRHYGVQSLRELVDVGFLRDGEFAALQEAQHFFWAVRFALHQLAGRREDRLLFDHQRDLARQFGHVDEPQSNQAVEQFMQRYYRTLQRLQRLNEMLLQLMREDILGLSQGRSTMIGEQFQIQGDYLGLVDLEALKSQPLLLFELFREMQRRPFVRGLRASTIRAIGESLPMIDAEFWQSTAARESFLALWEQRKRLPELLILMHRYQLLGRYLPAFAKVAGRMQFDLFHVYTVDYHTLFVVREACGLLRDDVDQQRYPLVAEVAPRLRKPELLLIACFFHDIAKGRGGDHSELGEHEVIQFARQHGLDKAATRLLAWLVRQHLLMSVTAQKKDIADPEVVSEFAAQVGNTRYLNYLYLLTIADICGTNPKLWTRWKASLLADLYRLTRAALRRGLDNPQRRATLAEETREHANRMLAESPLDRSAIARLWDGLDDDYFVRHSVEQITWHAECIASGRRPVVGTRHNFKRHVIELFVYADNIDGTFATIVTEIDRLNLSVVDAKLFNSADGTLVLDAFDVLAADTDAEVKIDSERVKERLGQALACRPLALATRQRPLSRQLRQFQFAPRITFSDLAGNRTLLELICIDQPGLLATVARVLLDQEVRIHNARIATFGERAEDYFWLTDRADQPLDAGICQALETELRAAIGQQD